MALPSDIDAFMECEGKTQHTLGGLFRTGRSIEDVITITIRKPMNTDASVMEYLAEEIRNAIDRYEPDE